MAETYVKVSGTWKRVSNVYVKVSGTWKEVQNGHVRVSGTWKKLFEPVVPGSITYSEPGSYNFVVPAHNTLQVELWGGGGQGAHASSSIISPNPQAGQNGSASIWNSGSMIANPGLGGLTYTNTGSNRPGGSASGGDVNTTGGSASGQTGGNCPNGGSGGPARDSLGGGHSAGSPGGGGGGARGTSFSTGGAPPSALYARGGSAAGYCKKTYLNGVFETGAIVPLVIGSRGNASTSYYKGGPGGTGQATIIWN